MIEQFYLNLNENVCTDEEVKLGMMSRHLDFV